MFAAHPETMNDQVIKALNGPLPDKDAINNASTAPPGRGEKNGPLPDKDANPNGPLPDMDEPKTIHVHSGLDEDIGPLPVTDAINTTTIDLFERGEEDSSWIRGSTNDKTADLNEDNNEIRSSMTGLDSNYAKLIRAEFFPTTEYDTPLGEIQDCSCNNIVEYTRKRRAIPSDGPDEPKKTCVRCPDFSFFSIGASPPGRNYIGVVPTSAASFSNTSFGLKYRETSFFATFDFLDEIYDSVDCALYEAEYKNPLDDRILNDLALRFASLNISKPPVQPSSECVLQPRPKDSDTSPNVSIPPKERSTNAQTTIDDCSSSPDTIDDATTRDQSMPLRRQSFRVSDDFHPVDCDLDLDLRSDKDKVPFLCSFSSISSNASETNHADMNSILGLSSIRDPSSNSVSSSSDSLLPPSKPSRKDSDTSTSQKIHDTSVNPFPCSSPDSNKSSTARFPPPTTTVSPSTTRASPSPTRSGSYTKADARPSLDNTSMAVPSSASDSATSLLKTAREPTPPPAPIRRPAQVAPAGVAPVAAPNPPRRVLNPAAARIQIQRNNLEARVCEGLMSVSLMLKDIASDHFDRTRPEALDLVIKIKRIRTSLLRLYTEIDTASKTVDAIQKSYDRVKKQLRKAEATMNRLDPIN